jgi:signal transduction histidine kinase
LKQVILLVIQDIQRRKQALSLRIDNGDSDGDTKILLVPSLAERGGYDDFTDIIVEADMEWIVQVLTNLLDNALKFTRKNNTISINVQINESEKNREVVVSVRDNGAGIDLEVMPKLFSKFTTKPSSISGKKEIGIGLGLYISRSIIEAHGGRIWGVNNTPDPGATFSFSLPWSDLCEI